MEEQFGIQVAGALNVRYYIPEYTLYVGDKCIYDGIKSNARILTIAVGKSSIVIVTDDPDLHKMVCDGYQDMRIGNMRAFSLDGTVIWHINDLVNDIHYPFCLGYIVDATERDVFANHQVPLLSDHEYYVGLTPLDEHYIIDLTTNEFITKIGFRT